MGSDIKFKDIIVKSGNKKTWLFNVAESAMTMVDVPVTVINGSGTGKTLCITAGVHGTEYVGIEAAIRLSRTVEPETLNGKLVIVSMVNMAGFQNMTYECPIDGKNIQGLFPGKSDGSISHQIAHTVFDQFISKADYYIDLHGGDTHESETPEIMFYVTGNKNIDAESEKLARHFGIECIVAWDKAPEGLTWREAAKRGIPAILCECGSGDKLIEREVQIPFNGVLNVMKGLGMTRGEKGKPSRTFNPKILREVHEIHSMRGGILQWMVEPGEIKRGDFLGEIKNIYGETVETITAPADAVILIMKHNPVVNSGDLLMYIGN
jgi:hypothetical protein